MVKNLTANEGDAGDMTSIPRSGRSPGDGNGTPLIYPYLEIFMGRGAWWATVHGATKSQMQLHTGEARIKFKIEYVAQ